MRQSIAHVALVVRDYDEAIAFFTRKLRFSVIEDTYQPAQGKRWVVVAPPNSTGTTLLLARASKPEQEAFIGNQTGGRVFLFLATDDLVRDYNEMSSRGIRFVRPPQKADYGTVAVFEDLYGNLWDLIEFAPDHPAGKVTGTVEGVQTGFPLRGSDGGVTGTAGSGHGACHFSTRSRSRAIASSQCAEISPR